VINNQGKSTNKPITPWQNQYGIVSRCLVCENTCDFVGVHLDQKIDQKKRLERIEQSAIYPSE